MTFAVSPSGSGSTGPSGSNIWENAGSLSMTATPSAGYTFSSWSSSTGSITFNNANSASATATISGTGTITATFTLTASLDHFVFNSVGSEIAGTPFSVTITAKDSSGNTVTSYSGVPTLTYSRFYHSNFCHRWILKWCLDRFNHGNGSRFKRHN